MCSPFTLQTSEILKFRLESRTAISESVNQSNEDFDIRCTNRHHLIFTRPREIVCVELRRTINYPFGRAFQLVVKVGNRTDPDSANMVDFISLPYPGS